MTIKVGFICVGNSCRSQMAEGFAKHYGKDVIKAFSAGTHPAPEINPNAVAVMKEKGIDLSGQYPKLLKDIPAELDILITMGCNVECPFVPRKIR
jgi:arsenate reductase